MKIESQPTATLQRWLVNNILLMDEIDTSEIVLLMTIRDLCREIALELKRRSLARPTED